MAGALWLIAGACLVPVAAVLLQWAANRWRFRRVPGPFAPPVIGNLPAIQRHGMHNYILMCRRKYGPVFKVYLGARMYIFTGDPHLNRRVLYRLVNHHLPPAISAKKGASVRQPLMRGLFGATGEEWRSLRHAWQAAFTSTSLAGYAPLMDAAAAQLCANLEGAAASREQVDMWREIGRMTLSVVGSCAYGIDFHTLDGAAQGGDEGGRELVAACQMFFQEGMLAMGSIYGRAAVLLPGLVPVLQWMACRLPDKALVRLTKARETLHATSTALLRDWRAAQAAGASGGGAPGGTAAAAGGGGKAAAGPAVPLVLAKAQGCGSDSSEESEAASVASHGASSAADDTAAAPDSAAAAAAGGAAVVAAACSSGGGGAAAAAAAVARSRGVRGIAPGSFLGLLLGDGSKGQRFDDELCLAQSNTFILAGFETTANALSYAVWGIAAHPHVQARVLAEVDAFGRGRAVTHDDVQPGAGHFPYLEATVKEALRLFPPASAIHRDVHLQGGFEVAPGVHMRKGEPLYVAIYAVHHDPEVWPAAEEFRPERFLPEGSALAPSVPLELAYTPFGGGARLCVGARFALQEVLVTLVRLHQRFTFELGEGMVPLPLKQAMTLSPRDGVRCRVVGRA